jgi:uncharacterized protein (DUF1501 family)
MDPLTRRRFLKALSAGGAAYAFAHTPGVAMAQAASVGGFSDYKALVCVFLLGGNDSWSIVVPRSDAEYAAYAASRQNLAIALDTLLPIEPLQPDGFAYGVHPLMPGLQSLFESGHCAVVANLGPLFEPVTLEQYQQGSVALPPQLFSHNDQQRQWHTLGGAANSRTGWAGRVADVLAEQTSTQQLPLNISLSGTAQIQASAFSPSYVMSPGGSVFTDLAGTGSTAARRAAFERLVQAEQTDVFGRAFADVQDRALRYSTVINSALTSAPPLGTAFPGSALGAQLQTVARMIGVRDRFEMSRQVFYVGVGGFDTHDDQLLNQPGLLSDVSASLAAFYNATVELGVASNVTTFTQSDFARTLTSNGDGSDHGWGGLQFVIGDAVKGRTLYGRYPLLDIGGASDIGGGRFIPDVSIDQYAATLARWFGVDPALLPLITPHLANFTQHDLGFMA